MFTRRALLSAAAVIRPSFTHVPRFVTVAALSNNRGGRNHYFTTSADADADTTSNATNQTKVHAAEIEDDPLILLKELTSRVFRKESLSQGISFNFAQRQDGHVPSIHELASHLCQAYLQLTDVDQSDRYTYTEILAMQERVLNQLALELGGPNPSLHEIEKTIQSYLREVDASSSSSTGIPSLFLDKAATADHFDEGNHRGQHLHLPEQIVRYEAIIHERIRPICTPRYEVLFSSILAHTAMGNALGMKFIVQLRQDLLHYIQRLHDEGKGIRSQHHSPKQEEEDFIQSDKEDILQKACYKNKEFILFRLKQMNEDLKRMLSTWFSAGILGKYCLRCLHFHSPFSNRSNGSCGASPLPYNA